MAVGDYFDGQAGEYFEERVGMQPYHRITARKIETELRGDVLSVGGLWFGARTDSPEFHVTVTDLSSAMLRSRDGTREVLVRANALQLPFRVGAFDHVVFPLVLHHIAGQSARAAREGVLGALRQAASVLRPGGRLWINEFCVPNGVYTLELAAVPITRRVLALLETPLVVMHSAAFYAEALRDAGFADARFEPIETPDAKPLDWIRPILGVSFIKIPRVVYPVTPTLITAVRPPSG